MVAIFSPTKHPYGQSNSKNENLRRTESHKVSFDVPQDRSVYKNIFNQTYSIPQNSNQLNRPVQSAIGFRQKSAKNDEVIYKFNKKGKIGIVIIKNCLNS